MAPELYKVSVPGSMMLLGEHAVLNGKPAVVCAVNKRLTLQLIPRSSQQITIADTRLGTLSQELSQLQMVKPFQFVLAAILRFKDKLRSGFDININSEFSSVIGLGSSAAVTVATVAVLGKWLHHQALTEAQIFTLAKNIMLEVQNCGSGADLAASVYGGVLSYHGGYRVADHSSVCKFARLPSIPNLTAVYCGYKTPTPEVIKIVSSAQQKRPKVYADIYNNIHACVQQAITAIKSANWHALGTIFNRHHALQVALGVSDPLLNDLAKELRSQNNIYGAKISGAGLGDCVIGLRHPKAIVSEFSLLSSRPRSGPHGHDAVAGIQSFEISVEPKGLTYDYN